MNLMKPRVSRAAVQQIMVSSHRFNAAIGEYNHHIGVTNGGQAVSNDEAGATLGDTLHSALNEVFALCVQVTGGFIQQKDFRIAQNGARDADPLTFTARQTEAALADGSLVTLVCAPNEVMRQRGSGGRFNLFVGGVR
jgi:hypothetical protein